MEQNGPILYSYLVHGMSWLRIKSLRCHPKDFGKTAVMWDSLFCVTSTPPSINIYISCSCTLYNFIWCSYLNTIQKNPLLFQVLFCSLTFLYFWFTGTCGWFLKFDHQVFQGIFNTQKYNSHWQGILILLQVHIYWSFPTIIILLKDFRSDNSKLSIVNMKVWDYSEEAVEFSS